MIRKILREEILVPLIIIFALAVASLPYFYEYFSVRQRLRQSRYPLFESDFAPDLRFYLSRVREGYEGKWLVYEKYTSEIHKPSILHISYLLMGKLSGLIGIVPEAALPIWRVLCGGFMLIVGYFFILFFFKEKKTRLAAFLLFVFCGNFPVLAKSGIPLLGRFFSSYLAWFTFYDPAKRVVFLPHYTLSAGLLTLTMVFLWRAFEEFKLKEFAKAGLLAVLTGLVLPHTLLIIIFTAGLLMLMSFWDKLGKVRIVNLIRDFTVISLPFWLMAGLCLLLFKFSLSCFPWDVQSLSDASKRGTLVVDYRGIIFGLGTTGVVGFLGAIWVLVRRQRNGYPAAFWLLATVFWFLFFTVFPISHPLRFTQIDLHLPLAVTTVIFLNSFTPLRCVGFTPRKSLVFILAVALLLLPSILAWSVSLKAQKMFVDDKLRAEDILLVPQSPYVIYPNRLVMEGVFWLRDRTNHDKVVLAADTLGNMIPAYAGNFVYLGHGNQTVYYEAKMALMKEFFSGDMVEEEAKKFLQESRISYVFWGPEEKSFGQPSFPYNFLQLVFQNEQVKIFWVQN